MVLSPRCEEVSAHRERIERVAVAIARRAVAGYVADQSLVVTGRTNRLAASRLVHRASAAVVLLCSAASHAQPSGALRVDYLADADCPAARVFIDELHARSPATPVVDEGRPTPTLVVRITRQKQRVVGRLTLRAADGSGAVRTLEGVTCTEVASGLALIAAVAVSSNAPVRDDASVTEPPKTPAASAAGGPIPTVAPSIDADVKNESVGLPRESTPPAKTAAPRPESVLPGWQLAIGAQGEIVWGASPNLLATVPIFVDVSRRANDVFSPAVRLRFERAGSGAVEVGSQGAQFTLTAGSLDVCPLAWSLATVRLTPCVRAVVGALEGTGRNVQPTRSGLRPWITAGLLTRARRAIVTPLFLEMEGALFAPLVRDRFFLEPATTVQRAPIVGFSAGIGIGLSFW